MGAIDFLCRPLSHFQPGESKQNAKWLSADTFSTQRSNVFNVVAVISLFYVLECYQCVLKKKNASDLRNELC